MEIEINKKCFDIAEEYLTTNIMKNSIIDYKKTIPAIVYLCKKKINHGSVQSIRSHVQTLTSEVAPFEIIKQKKGKIIQKRAS